MRPSVCLIRAQSYELPSLRNASDRFGRMLVETTRTINPNLTIIDGITAHEGNDPSGGEPRYLGLLGASPDVFADGRNPERKSPCYTHIGCCFRIRALP